MLPFFIMARLILLLSTIFISFNSYAVTYETASEAYNHTYNYYSSTTCTSGTHQKVIKHVASSKYYYVAYRAGPYSDGSVGSWSSCGGKAYYNVAEPLPDCDFGYSDYNMCQCEEGESNNPDGTCSAEEPHSCPDAGTFYKRLQGGPSLNGYSTCLPENCVIAIQKPATQFCIQVGGDGYPNSCDWDLFYTGQTCSYDPNNPGLNPPDHEYPQEPVEPPAPDTPDITDLPDGDGGGLPVYDPDDDGLPDDPATPPNPDPQPDPDDPNLTTGENAIVGELSEANQRLENIDHVLQDLTNTTKADNDTALAYAAQFLGQMTEINRELDEGGLGSGGGGGSGTGTGEGDGTCEEDCVPVNFPGAPEVVDPFAEILDETDINDIITRTEDTKTQLEAKMNNFKGLFSVPNYGAGGTITPIEFDLQHRDTTIPVKFGIFDIIAPDIASIITLIAAVICFLIVTTRR